MKLTFLALMAIVIGNGCASLPPNEPAPTNTTLVTCVKPDFHPVLGDVYEHNGKGLRVFQALNDAVMVEVSGEAAGLLYDSINMIVKTSKGYVDDEMLRPGKYEYVGPYRYETIGNTKRTIRAFREVE